MLNLFNLKESNKTTKILSGLNDNNKKTSKHFPSPLREWKNSIYVYNKNSLNLIPSTTKSVNNIIKGYFNLYNKRIEIKLRTRRLRRRVRRITSNKYYISNGGFKHTNNKVLVNLFVYNRQKTNYLLALKKRYLNRFLNKTSNKKIDINFRIIKRLKLINEKGIQAIKVINKNKFLLIKAINSILKNKKYKINTFKDLSIYTENFYKKLIKKSLKKIKMYFFYKQLLFINKSKLNYTYLQYLKKHLERMYSKNVEFNIINIKRFYLNSDVFSEIITTKTAKKRRKLRRYLNRIRDKLTNTITANREESFFNKLKPTSNVVHNLSHDRYSLREYIYNNLKYKRVTGYRIEAKGRLHRRYTASRSQSRLKYDGGLLNRDSSFRGLSSVILKGNLRSNVQYTNLKGKSRVGSFGVKGWVSGN